MDVLWEERVFALFDDLEMQADGLFLDERDREVEALAGAGYAEVTLAGRLHASLGRPLRIGLADGSEATGVLARCGAGWLLLGAASGSWLVPQTAVVLVAGLAAGSVPEASRPLTARLSIGSVLRRLAKEDPACVLRLHGGRQLEADLLRVGADFVAVRAGGTDLDLPFSALIAVRGRP